MASRITSDAVAEIALRMRSHFLVPFPLESSITSVLELSKELPISLRQPIEAFCDAINAIIATTTLPYQLASSRASAIHFQRVHMAERIRTLKIEPGDVTPPKQKKVDEKAAYETACKRFAEFQESDEGTNAIVGEISSVLVSALNDPSTAKAADELLYQAVISLWSAFEVFARDELILILNGWPSCAEKILSDPGAKKLFELPKISIEDLSSADFDLSNRMGSILFGSRDFSDIRTIRSAIYAICGESRVRSSLGDDLLWNLNQDRHVIVHRRGIVDKKYFSASTRQVAIGSRIKVTPEDVESYFSAVVGAAISILQGISGVVSNLAANPDDKSSPVT